MRFFGFGREHGRSMSNGAAKEAREQEEQKIQERKELRELALSDAFKKKETEEEAAPKASRETPHEFTEAELSVNMLMGYYKEDPDMAAALAKDPEGAAEFRKILAEKAGSGASDAKLAEFAAALFEQRFGLADKDVVVGTPIEDEEGKKAA